MCKLPCACASVCHTLKLKADDKTNWKNMLGATAVWSIPIVATTSNPTLQRQLNAKHWAAWGAALLRGTLWLQLHIKELMQCSIHALNRYRNQDAPVRNERVGCSLAWKCHPHLPGAYWLALSYMVRLAPAFKRTEFGKSADLPTCALDPVTRLPRPREPLAPQSRWPTPRDSPRSPAFPGDSNGQQRSATHGLHAELSTAGIKRVPELE